MGMKALESHAKSSEHINALNGQKQTPSIACVFQPTNVSQLSANVPEVATGANVSQLAASAADPPAMAATRVDLRTAFGPAVASQRMYGQTEPQGLGVHFSGWAQCELGLARDADRLAEEAERKAGSKMADLISRSNLLRKGHKEKLTELAVLDKDIAALSEELRS
ncbi:hypothetical protein HF521_010266 [Silurus meridionalis]|uniref:Uncharacterized protein n=1 Tax=Silurus meridionalis TaxID=175797 RepID=A0A8T0ALP5_SILME|nr:hypothetical protein HF521_010266 [Silurus meridionalis]